MLTKDKVRILIDGLPETFTIEDIVEKLVFLDKIEKGLKDIEEGRVYTTEQVQQILTEGFKRHE